jgi:hypothetical protein
MIYKIFLSYAADEIKLAEFVRDKITNAFKGNISFFLASDDIPPGSEWKNETKKVLKEYDCIMTLLTAKYIVRPWAYVEWTAFWINDKKSYTLVTDDVKLNEVFEPMRDRQLAELFSENNMKQLFEELAKDTNTTLIPYEQSVRLSAESKLIYDKILEDRDRLKYGIYKENIFLIGNDDLKKEDVLWYFYEKEPNEETVINIFNIINDSVVKTRILLSLLDKENIDLVSKLYDKVVVKNNLLPVFSRVVDIDKNSDLIELLAEHVKDSQEVLRNMGQILIEKKMESSIALTNIVNHFTNMAELKKIGYTLIEKGYSGTPIFDSIMDKLYERNRAEARNLLINTTYNIDKFTPREMTEHIAKLAALNKTEAFKVPELFPTTETYKEIVVALLEKKVFTVEQEEKLKVRFGL